MRNASTIDYTSFSYLFAIPPRAVLLLAFSKIQIDKKNKYKKTSYFFNIIISQIILIVSRREYCCIIILLLQ